MNILVLVSRDWTNPYVAGGDIHVSEYAKYLSTKGHKITLICSRYPGCKSEEILEDIHIVRLSGIWLLSFMSLIYYLRNCKERYDLVIEEVLGGSRIPFLAPLYIREQIIGLWYQRNKKIFLNQFPLPLAMVFIFFERIIAIIHRKTRILTPSKTSLNELIELGLSKENLRASPPGVENYFIEEGERQKRELEKREELIISMGKLRKYKCYHHTIYAMKKVTQKHPKAKLIITGRKEDRKYEIWMRNLVKRLNLTQNIEIRTNISEKEKIELLCKARMLVVSSPVEGFGLVILEANACGTPVIASDGVPIDAVLHEYNGLRVPFGNIDAQSTAIIRLLDDDGLFFKLSENGCNFVKNFSWEQSLNKFIKNIEEFLE